MKIHKGKEKLGSYKKIPVKVDWDYLSKEVGLRKEEEIFEKSLGRFLHVMVIIYWIFLTVYPILNGEFIWLHVGIVTTLLKLSFWLSIFPFLYAFYLRRDRDVYLDRLKTKELTSLREMLANKEDLKEIEITTYFDHDLLNLLDDILSQYHDNFLPELLNALLGYPLIQRSLLRLGLDIKKFNKIARGLELSGDIHVNNWLKPTLIESFFIAFTNRFAHVDELALFLFLVKRPLKSILLEYDVSEKEVEAIELWAKNEADKRRYIKLFKEKSALKPTSIVNRAYTSSYSPTLMKFSRDFTAEVVNGDFTMSIARENELNEVISQIQEGSKSAVMVLGAPGVGKTTLLKSLAVRMVVEDVPELLQDMRLVSLDFSRAYALSSNLEKFKSVIEKALEETAKTKNIILVIDDLDELVNIRREYSAEVVSLITKALDNYKIRIIATSSLEGVYKAYKTL